MPTADLPSPQPNTSNRSLKYFLVVGVVLVVALALIPPTIFALSADKDAAEAFFKAAEGSGGLAAAVAVIFAALAVYFQSKELREARELTKEEGRQNREALEKQKDALVEAAAAQRDAKEAQQRLATQFERVAVAQEKATEQAKRSFELEVERSELENAQRRLALEQNLLAELPVIVEREACRAFEPDVLEQLRSLYGIARQIQLSPFSSADFGPQARLHRLVTLQESEQVRQRMERVRQPYEDAHNRLSKQSLRTPGFDEFASAVAPNTVGTDYNRHNAEEIIVDAFRTTMKYKHVEIFHKASRLTRERIKELGLDDSWPNDRVRPLIDSILDTWSSKAITYLRIA